MRRREFIAGLGLASGVTKEMERAAQVLGLGLVVLDATTSAEIERAFVFAAEKADPLVLGGDAFFSTYRYQVIELVARYGVPTIYENRRYVAAGGAHELRNGHERGLSRCRRLCGTHSQG